MLGSPDISWTRDDPRAAEIPGMTLNATAALPRNY